MRLVDWNIEHMNSWFVANNDPNSPALRQSSTGRGGRIDDVPALAQRCANVLQALDPDVINIQESAGADEVALFLQQFMPTANWTVIEGSGGAQKLVVAARLDRVVSAVAEAPVPAGVINLNDDYEADTDGDSVVETDTGFARPPLVVDITAHNNQTFKLINCHLKSKFIRNGERLFNGSQAERLEFIRGALINRRRISAEAFRVRTYLDGIFGIDPNSHVIVAGDLNDGPGFDFFERTYLTHSIVDLAFGSVLIPEGRMTHTLIRTGQPRPRTAVFDDFVGDGVNPINNRPLLLDHVGVSPSLVPWVRSSEVADAVFDAQSELGAANERERLVSDHRPILTVLEPPP